ncbi:hypothetical protein VCO01S_19830 [Vibrio comitans NBRC 102076]|uniref:Uncharacterized protein n=2 Tax=Vibrio comitans TaxID=413401 RepID=A0A4Y3IPY2_9VIBR|nr:hypothetical protein VCO01S_19830 [Vibrio comitans NBRC 102076]
MNVKPDSLSKELKQQLSKMDPNQLAWFELAYGRYDSFEIALQISQREDSLEFDLKNRRLFVKGIEIPMAKTPLFYYYWYAKRKQMGDEPYINPSKMRPDTIAGAQLADIMHRYNGTDRTIEELKKHGLKAKSLDLNRNKVKEILIDELGELAQAYLFDSQRDARDARSRYQLKLASSSISFRP